MSERSALRRRITPSVPCILPVEDADGSKFDVSFQLTFDFNAMALVEEKTGLSMLTGDVAANPSAKKTAILLWAACQENSPEFAGPMGLSAIGSYLNVNNAKIALRAINDAFFASLPKERAAELKAAAEAASKENPPVEQVQAS